MAVPAAAAPTDLSVLFDDATKWAEPDPGYLRVMAQVGGTNADNRDATLLKLINLALRSPVVLAFTLAGDPDHIWVGHSLSHYPTNILSATPFDNKAMVLVGQDANRTVPIGVPPSLSTIRDQGAKLSYLLVSGQRYRETGQANKPVRAGSVEDALLAVGKGISDLGEADPRKLGSSDRNHPLLTASLKGLSSDDPAATRVYPANASIVRNVYSCLDFEHPEAGAANRVVADLIVVASFWLMRPGEYLKTSSPDARSSAFTLGEIEFQIDGRLHPASSAPLNDGTVNRIEYATLTFSDQKNAVRGKQISHRSTNDSTLCPCRALGRLARRLRDHNLPHTTPIYTYITPAGTTAAVHPSWITNALQHSAKQLETTTGIPPNLITARSLRAGGATALLCANVDPEAIQLLGRWQSDAMLRYLRVQATATRERFGQHMLDHGSYTFSTLSSTPTGAAPLPDQVPPAVARAATVAAAP